MGTLNKLKLSLLVFIILAIFLWYFVNTYLIFHHGYSVTMLGRGFEREDMRAMRDILILTSGRSGSTFLGKLFEENNASRSTYVFEPLREIVLDVFKAGTPCKFKGLQVVADIYSCQFINRTYPVTTSEGCAEAADKVIDKYSRKGVCNGSRIILKELAARFPDNGTSVLEKLLKKLKKIKIIHLIRDPREVIPSMDVLGWITGNATTREYKISRICQVVWNSIKYARENAGDLTKRYKLVEFKEMMSNPSKTAQVLYDFVGIGPVPDSIRKWIYDSTNKEGYGGISYSTNRNTSKVLKRKITLTNEMSVILEKHCGHITRFIQNRKDS